MKYFLAPYTAHRKYKENVNCYYNNYYHFLHIIFKCLSLFASITFDNSFLQHLLKSVSYLVICLYNFSLTRICPLKV